MRPPVRLREDYDARQLRALAKASRDANQTRRLLALAAIYDGGSRGEAARIGGVGIQTVRDWVLAFNAAGPPGLIDGKAPGNQPLLNAEQRAALQRIIEAGPNPAVDGVVRWRLIDLAQWISAEFGISISKQTLSRVLRAMGYRKLTARPRHYAQDPAALEAFKKTSPRVWRRSHNMRPQASRSSCGFRTKRASDRRPRSPGAGPSAAPGQWRRAISAPPRPIFSAPSAHKMARARPWSCHAAIARR
jgi:transposase